MDTIQNTPSRPVRGLAALLLGLVALALLVAPVASHAFGEEKRVVWHVGYDDLDRASSMLGSINRMVQSYEGELLDYDVRVVFRSGGIKFVTDDPMTDTPFAVEPGSAEDERRQEIATRFRSLQANYGVKLELCGTTRGAANLSDEALMDGVEMIESGVLRIAELQHRGFAYLQVY